MNTLSLVLIPILVVGIIVYGLFKKVDIYSSFIKGAKDGIGSAFSIFPFTVAMVFAVNIFLHSGILDWLFGAVAHNLGPDVPISIFPMAILRPISGSASQVIMTDIFKLYGPDSFIGRLASTLQGSTDTTFYVITLYFGSIGIKKIRYALKAGLFADLVGILASVIVVSIFFGM
ncbi:MAG TPA: spore maturation protein [Firmicutes bacterium]|nr:spore maturation protein [Bacillota bacterium]